ncbi:MAG: response regulator transcription factor [Chloroflexota bacterium]|nr:response regulator transcription factor [Chloroflexota bacterium]
MSNLETPINVLIVEADGLLRDMLHTVLRAQRRVHVVGVTGDISEAVQVAAGGAPDVALIGLDQDDAHVALSVAEAIAPRVRIVFFGEHPGRRTLAALPAFRAAGWSYVLRQSVNDVATLVRAIEGAAMGLVVLDPLVVESLGRRDARLSSLTKRQLEVLSLMAKGHNNAAIARALVLEEKSVENHINAIFGQLNLNRDRTAHPRVKAVLLFLHETTGVADADLSEAKQPHKAA